MRYSRQRQLVYEFIQNNRIHPTADVIYTALKADNPGLSLGTVYRNLNVLHESGEIYKIEVLGGSDRFDAKSEPHFHMHCTQCDGVVDIPYSAVPPLYLSVFSQSGHKITGYDIAFKGVCNHCLDE